MDWLVPWLALGATILSSFVALGAWRQQTRGLGEKIADLAKRADKIEARLDALPERVATLESRLFESPQGYGPRLHKLENHVTGLPVSLLHHFMSSSVAAVLIDESKTDRARLSREVDQLWAAIKDHDHDQHRQRPRT